jgi:hypothetical protein
MKSNTLMQAGHIPLSHRRVWHLGYVRNTCRAREPIVSATPRWSYARASVTRRRYSLDHQLLRSLVTRK